MLELVNANKDTPGANTGGAASMAPSGVRADCGGTYRATVTFDPQPATSSTATAATIRRFIEPPLGFDVLQVLTDRTDTVRGVLIQPV